MAMNLPPGFVLDENKGQTSKQVNLPPGFELDTEPIQQKNQYAEMAYNAIGQTPLGMASQGMGAIGEGIGAVTQPYIQSPQALTKPISAVFRGSRALGVGGALNTVMTPTPTNILNTAQRMKAAYQPGYQPANRVESVGSYIGQNAPVVAATALNPAVAGPLSMASQQIAETGKFSPVVAGTAAAPFLGKTASNLGVSQARRALGFNKGMLKTPFSRGQAQMAAQTALEEGVIPPVTKPFKLLFNSPQKMLDRATAIGATEGERIGQILRKTPADYGMALNNLENVRTQLTQGVSGGVYGKVNTAIDEIKNTITEMPVTNASGLNALKNRIGKSVNYLADLAAQSDNKAIVNNLANSVRDMVKTYISPEEFTSYLRSQKLFNASELMQKALNNEVSGQMSNMPISLPATVAGAGMAAVSAPKAAATAGLFEGIKRFGSSPSARILSDVGKQSEAISGTVTGTMLGKILTPTLAKKYLEKAKGDKNLARKMAKSDGWRIPKK